MSIEQEYQPRILMVDDVPRLILGTNEYITFHKGGCFLRHNCYGEYPPTRSFLPDTGSFIPDHACQQQLSTELYELLVIGNLFQTSIDSDKLHSLYHSPDGRNLIESFLKASLPSEELNTDLSEERLTNNKYVQVTAVLPDVARLGNCVSFFSEDCRLFIAAHESALIVSTREDYDCQQLYYVFNLSELRGITTKYPEYLVLNVLSYLLFLSESLYDTENMSDSSSRQKHSRLQLISPVPYMRCLRNYRDFVTSMKHFYKYINTVKTDYKRGSSEIEPSCEDLAKRAFSKLAENPVISRSETHSVDTVYSGMCDLLRYIIKSEMGTVTDLYTYEYVLSLSALLTKLPSIYGGFPDRYSIFLDASYDIPYQNHKPEHYGVFIRECNNFVRDFFYCASLETIFRAYTAYTGLHDEMARFRSRDGRDLLYELCYTPITVS